VEGRLAKCGKKERSGRHRNAAYDVSKKRIVSIGGVNNGRQKKSIKNLYKEGKERSEYRQIQSKQGE
jgi:hypothetical protein